MIDHMPCVLVLYRYCLPDSLSPDLANGTIVLCDGLSDGEPVAASGAAGAILHEDRLRDVALSFPLPASYLGSSDGGEVYDYINTTRFVEIPYFYFQKS